MEEFNHILNWKLLRGSHEFPGPEGGTCINEAAVVAAGFRYRKINIAQQLPGCFCRAIGEYVLRVNDCANDEERARLLPYVTRLAGTVDTTEATERRLNAGMDYVEALLGTPPDEWGFLAAQVRDARGSFRFGAGASAGGSLATVLMHVARHRGDYMDHALAVLDIMLAIGNQAPPSDITQVQARMDAARQAAEPVPA